MCGKRKEKGGQSEAEPGSHFAPWKIKEITASHNEHFPVECAKCREELHVEHYLTLKNQSP